MLTERAKTYKFEPLLTARHGLNLWYSLSCPCAYQEGMCVWGRESIAPFTVMFGTGRFE